MDKEVIVKIEVPFPTNRHADIVYQVLKVDTEPKRSEVKKTLDLQDNILKVCFYWNWKLPHICFSGTDGHCATAILDFIVLNLIDIGQISANVWKKKKEANLWKGKLFTAKELRKIRVAVTSFFESINLITSTLAEYHEIEPKYDYYT